MSVISITGLHHVAFAHAPSQPLHPALAALLGLSVVSIENGEGFTERSIPCGEVFIQTLEATGAGVVQRSLERRGSGLHHIAIEVADIHDAIDRLQAFGVRMIDREPRLGGMGTVGAFIHPGEFAGLLIELVQTPGDSRKNGRKEERWVMGDG